ncbi:MAG: glycosyltransferase family 2 protein [Alphaproteobacteria bacterium]
MVKPLISIVCPVFNEEANIERMYARTQSAIASERDKYDFEYIFTDNHSTDATFETLAAIAVTDKSLRVYRFSRNFGYQRSIWTAYTKAQGVAAIQLDADLQDPPEMISEFLRHWEAGAKVVYGIRKSRQESSAITVFREIFYWLIDALSTEHLPRNAGDFRLIDRAIIDEISKIRDPNLYLRGRIAALGFRQIGIPYDREARTAGFSKFSLGHLFALAIDGITSHSAKPLRVATFLGLGTMFLALTIAAIYVVARLFFGADWPPGFATVVVLVLFFSALNFLLLGVLGEYVARIFEQVKLSAETIIETTINVQANGASTTPLRNRRSGRRQVPSLSKPKE